MFKHAYTTPKQPERVVILGAKGFVGSSTVSRLTQANIPILALGREDLDLASPNAGVTLARQLHPQDVLVITSAAAPCKSYTDLVYNLQMMQAVCDALSQITVQQVIYISSDAVYTDSREPLSELSLAAPTSLHGVMHLAREKMLESIVPADNLVILRPTLLYGRQDPHNGYGPNSFYRLVQADQPIVLFGEGEELRDHVYIEDVAEILYHCILYRSSGILNITTGEVLSFKAIAEMIVQLINGSAVIQSRPRTGPMPHNGYRAFDVSLRKTVFPHVAFKSLADGLRRMCH